jgi:hypothetical protein
MTRTRPDRTPESAAPMVFSHTVTATPVTRATSGAARQADFAPPPVPRRHQ